MAAHMDASQGVLLSSSLVGDAKGSASWPELLGSNHWDGLLDQLDLTLRRLILLCGDLCQVTYDSFNSDSHSKYCGSCRYSRSTLFARTLFPAAADVSPAAYLYATSQSSLPGGFMAFSLSREAWSKESNWIGYVSASTDAAAAATGHRVIYVAWRGTIRTLEWVDVLKPDLVSPDAILPVPDADPARGHARVMKGWYLIYTSSDERSPFNKHSARDQVLAAVRALAEKYRGESLSVVCTGHSLGASLATLSAFDIAANGVCGGGDVPVTAIVFGSPQIGNPEFKERFEAVPHLRALHVRNKPDVIPVYPSGLLGFANVGDLLEVDSRKSPYVKEETTNVGDYHNLQGILHTVAGWNGEDGEFELRVRRSVALVNKSSAFLKEENLVPESWWVERNKGMVIGDTGLWQLEPPAEENLPVPPVVVNGKVVHDDVAAGTTTTTTASKETKTPAEDDRKKGTGAHLFTACFRGVN